MTSLVLFGFVPDWVRSWLTPVWLLGLGSLLGLIVLSLLWGIFAVLSRVGPLQRLAESKSSRRGAVAILGTALSALLLWLTRIAASRAVGGGSIDEDGFYLASFFVIAIAFALAYLGIAFLSPRNVREIPLSFFEGVLWPITIIMITLAVFGVLGFGVVREPLAILSSITRVPYVGTRIGEKIIPASPEGEEPKQYPIEFNTRRNELKSFLIQSSESLELSPQLDSGGSLMRVDIRGGEPYRWAKNEEQLTHIFTEEDIPNMYVRNFGANDAKVEWVVESAPPTPEVWSVVITAALVCGVVLLYLLQRTVMPKAFAVALATSKSETAQPLFLIMTLLGIVSLAIFVFIPYNTLGEDIKMLKDTGLVTIMVIGIIQAIWGASTSISEEIEGRTALTVLSKPLGRRSFIFGKFLGIFWTVLLLFIILTVVFMIFVAYKPIYDARETSNEDPAWQECHFEMVRIMPGVSLAFMETILLAAISVAISTRLPMIANFVICMTIYVLGHLTPLIVQSTVKNEAFNIVVFVAQFIATLFPVLDHFNIQAAVAGGVDVPYSYLGVAFLYCSIYGIIALLLALFLFEDRDLA